MPTRCISNLQAQGLLVIVLGPKPAEAEGAHIHAGVCDPTAQFSSDDVAVIRTETAFGEEMIGRFQLLLEPIATGIIREGSAIGDG